MPNAFRTLSSFEVLFQYYLGKHCFFLSSETGGWNLLFPSRANLQPYHFELYFGKGPERDLRLRRRLERLRREKKSFRAIENGLVDLFTPVLSRNRYFGSLISGPVLAQSPTAASLRNHWKAITDSNPVEMDPDFLHFTRLILSLPVLDEEGLKGYSRTLELVGQWIQDPNTEGIKEEMELLLSKTFSPRLPHPYWVDWMVGTDKFFSKNERDNPISSWVRTELGISRVPTMAVALMPRTTVQAAIVENLCLAKAFQHEAYLASRLVPETAAKPLGDYGIVLLISGRPNQSARLQRSEIQEKIEVFRNGLDKKLQTRIYAGMGSLAQDVEDLPRSYREAVAALHIAVQSGKTLIQTEPGMPETENPTSQDIRSLVRSLVQAFGLASPARLKLAQDRFLRQLVYASHDQAITRVILVSALNALLDKFERDPAVDGETSQKLSADLIKKLDEAHTLPDMVQVFRRALDSLVRYQHRPNEAKQETTMRTLCQEIEKDPGRPWKLEALCRRSSLSAPTFLKRFKNSTGESFGRFLRRSRMEKAKDLLREGQMNLERVAQETGYGSASSFVQAFRRVYHTSPRNFKPKD